MLKISPFHIKEPTPLNAVNGTGTNGSVRPDGPSLIRIPYSSLEDVLNRMKSLVQKWKGSPEIRAKAVEITSGIPKDSRTGLPDRRNYDAIAQAVYTWMKKNIQYVRDPYEIELLRSPDQTLRLKYGDCDDQAILGASLMSSLGVPTQFKVVKANPSNPGVFTHVYVVYYSRGQWKAFDPTLHAQAGSELADHQIFGTKLIPLNDAALSDCGCQKKNIMQPRNRNFLGAAPIFDITTGQEVIDDDLGIAFTTAATAGASAIKAGAGLRDLFKKKDKNAGSSSFVDAMDNYEKVSTSLALSMVDPITEMLANGASDRDIASYIDSRSYKNGPDSMMGSYKWKYVKKWIDDTRAIIQANQSQGGSGLIRSQSAGIMSSPGNINLKNPLVIGSGVLLLAGVGYMVISQREKGSK